MVARVQPKVNAGFSQAAIDFEERWGEGDEEEELSGQDLCGASDSSVPSSLLRVRVCADASFACRWAADGRAERSSSAIC